MKFKKIESAGGGERSNKFIHLKDGESVKGVCRGEVYEFFVKWIDGKAHVVQSDAPGARSKFRVNLIVSENNQMVAKIYEFGSSVSNQFYHLQEDYDLSKTFVKISRKGSQMNDTEYMVIPLPGTPDEKALAKVELNVLEHKEKPQEESQSYQSKIPPHLRKTQKDTPPEDLWDNSPEPGDTEDIPF
jgi:hypothetical protein